MTKRTEQRCPIMTGDEGTWNFVNCKTAYSRVVCKTEAGEYRLKLKSESPCATTSGVSVENRRTRVKCLNVIFR